MEYKTIPLTRDTHALVSPQDFDRVSEFAWYLHSAGYAARTLRYGEGGKKKRVIYMHRFVLNAPGGMEVDHVNGDRLDNRRENLRLVTKSQQLANKVKRSTSTRQYKGVVHIPGRNRPWTARVTFKGETSYGRYFETEIEAAREYDRMARVVHGQFARLNFPD